MAILRHLGRKYNLDGNNEAERNRIELVEQQVADLNGAFFPILFGDPNNYEKARANYLAKLPDQLRALTNFLQKPGTGRFVAGTNNVSYVDFWLYEYLVRVLRFAPEQFNQFPALQQYIRQVEALPRLAEWLQRTGPQPFITDNLKWHDQY